MFVHRELDAATISRALRPESNLIDRSTQNRGLDGVQANRPMLGTVTGFCQEQGLLSDKPCFEELFAPSTLDA
jgi:hypothetical protein